MFSPGIEPGTFCVLDRCDNRYTTKTSLQIRYWLKSKDTKNTDILNLYLKSHKRWNPKENPLVKYSTYFCVTDGYEQR